MLESSMWNFLLNKILWIFTAVVALVAALAGAVRPDIYNGIMADKLMPGTIAQDWLTIAVAVGLLVLISKTNKDDIKKQIIILGIIGSLGYLYAIFSIERIYTVLYLVYLAILGLALYSIPTTISSIKIEDNWKLPEWLRVTTIIFSGVIAVLFSFLWIGALIPVMGSGKTIELYYSIYILDLVWIMPGFLITAVLSYKRKPLGYFLTAAMYILGIFVIFPLGLGELVKSFFGMPYDGGGMWMSFGLSGMFLILAMIQLKTLRKSKAV